MWLSLKAQESIEPDQNLLWRLTLARFYIYIYDNFETDGNEIFLVFDEHLTRFFARGSHMVKALYFLKEGQYVTHIS